MGARYNIRDRIKAAFNAAMDLGILDRVGAIRVASDGGFTRAQAAQFALSAHDKWWHGLERVEWPDLFPTPEPMTYEGQSNGARA